MAKMNFFGFEIHWFTNIHILNYPPEMYKHALSELIDFEMNCIDLPNKFIF